MIQDILARVVRAREALEDDELGLAFDILEALERDVAEDLNGGASRERR